MKRIVLSLLVSALAGGLPPFARAEGPPPAASVALPFALDKFDDATLYAQKSVVYGKRTLEKNELAVGKITALVYVVRGDHTPLEIGENYKQSLVGQGFTVLAAAEGKSIGQMCWTLDLEDICYRSGVYGESYKLQVKKSDAAGDTFVDIVVGQAKDQIKGRPAGPKPLPDMVVEPGENTVVVQIITPKTLDNHMVKEDPSFILGQLKASGKVDLYGINFDTDAARIRPESADVVAAIAAALRQDATLRLEVAGHTDNVGPPAHNLALSRERAAAVVAALVAKGIAPDRLRPEGYGATRPVATNDTEAGRAKNRRVELARQS